MGRGVAESDESVQRVAGYIGNLADNIESVIGEFRTLQAELQKPPPPPTHVEYERRLWDCGFESWPRRQSHLADQIRPALPLSGLEKSFLTFEVRPGDKAKNWDAGWAVNGDGGLVPGPARAELVLTDTLGPGQNSVRFHEGFENTFEWETYFPKDYPYLGWKEWQIGPLQIHGTYGDNGEDMSQSFSKGPPMGFTIHGPHLRLRVQGGYYDSLGLWEQSGSSGKGAGLEAGVVWEMDFVPGARYKFKLSTYWSRGPDAWLELAVDDVVVTWPSGSQRISRLPLVYGNMDIQGPNYLKYGLYVSDKIQVPLCLYNSDLVIKYRRPA